MFAPKMVLACKLQSNFDFAGRGREIFNFLLYFDQLKGMAKSTNLSISGTSCYFGQTPPVAARHNAGKA